MLVFSAPVWALCRWGFGLLRTIGQNIAFWLTVPLILSAATLLWFSPVAPVPAPTPDLLGSIDAVNVFQSNECQTPMPYPNNDPDDVYLLIAANVRNSGSPSIADNWSLTINSLSKGSITPEGFQLSDSGTMVLTDPTTKQQFPYSGHDALYEKAFDSPVGQGAVVRGILLYRIKGFAPADITHPGTDYKLSFTDILGKAKTIDWKWPEINRPIGHFAGLLSPTVPSPDALPTTAPRTALDLLR